MRCLMGEGEEKKRESFLRVRGKVKRMDGVSLCHYVYSLDWRRIWWLWSRKRRRGRVRKRSNSRRRKERRGGTAAVRLGVAAREENERREGEESEEKQEGRGRVGRAGVVAEG